MFLGHPVICSLYLRMLCLIHHLYIYVITCAYSHIVYTKNQQKLLIFLKPKKTRKNPTPTLEKVRLG